MRTSLLVGFIWVSSFLLSTPAQGAGKVTFEGFLFPNSVIVDDIRSMTLCLVNQGEEAELINAGVDEDHLMFYIPLGSSQTDLDVDGSLLSCTTPDTRWRCNEINTSSTPAVIRLEPAVSNIIVAQSETVCFDISGVQVNDQPGLSFCDLEQFIPHTRANTLIERPLAVFKMENGIIRHGDLSDVTEFNHHYKTTSFTELADSATDDQIPNTITVNVAQHALTAGTATTATHADTAGYSDDSGTLDTLDSTAFASAGHNHSVDSNTSVGSFALASNTTGADNAAFGRYALRDNTEGSYNAAFGTWALQENRVGNSNTAFGFSAASRNIDAGYNTAFGYNALYGNVYGGNNTAIGGNALFNLGIDFNKDGIDNTAVGHAALYMTRSGEQNTAVGKRALFNSKGSFNIALGAEAGMELTNGSGNIYVGNKGIGTEDAVIRIGKQGTHLKTFVAGIYGVPLTGSASPVVVNTSGQLGVGGFGSISHADLADVEADQHHSWPINFSELGGTATDAQIPNTISIDQATNALQLGGFDPSYYASTVHNHTNPFRNVAVGLGALISITSGRDNTAVGSYALTSNTTGLSNSAFGLFALEENIGGHANAAFGAYALSDNLAGSNSAFGFASLTSNTTGYSNTASGESALWTNKTGHSNTAMGARALLLNTAGNLNVALGKSALNLNTTANENTAAGANALYSNSEGSFNVAVGSKALYESQTGSQNIAIGAYAGTNLADGSDNIYLGNPGESTESGVIKIGQEGTQAKTMIAGILNGNIGTIASEVYINYDGQLGTQTSSRRFKEDVRAMADSSQNLMKLRPVSFRYKKATKDGSKPLQFGLIAEEVAEVFPELVRRDENGEPFTVHYHFLNSLLLNELQKQNRKIEQQEKQIQELRELLERLLATATLESMEN